MFTYIYIYRDKMIKIYNVVNTNKTGYWSWL